MKNDDKPARWLSETEFKQMLSIFVKHINEGKTIGLRIFRAADLKERPEYMTCAKEVGLVCFLTEGDKNRRPEGQVCATLLLAWPDNFAGKTRLNSLVTQRRGASEILANKWG